MEFLMKKLHEALQHKLLPGLIGIEIECEGQNLVPIDDEFWKTEDDGSLRGSFPEERSEYVLNCIVEITTFVVVVIFLIPLMTVFQRGQGLEQQL